MSPFRAIIALFALSSLAELQFNRDIRPILSNKCFSCHGPSSHRKADLRLDTFAGATAEVIVPGKPEASPLVDRILSEDPDDIMPPPESHKSLTTEEKSLLQRWIREGAKYQKHWSFLPLNAPPKSSIDALAKPQQPAADKRSLIRRVSLDLTGLPPTDRELRDFLADSAGRAYERLVDRLLDSPRYGEHMAKYWLDLVRYGDSHGIHADNYREMWLYRDWVIKAFNANQPFDEFTLDQVAGDLRPARTTEQLIASGFNRLHISNSAGSALKEELYVNNVTDRVNAIGTVYLGLTLGCAACHDHKYDPITQKEYYQLFAFFNNLDGPPDNKGHQSPAPSLTIPTEADKILAENLRSRIAAAPTPDELLQELAMLEGQAAGTTLIMKERAGPRPAYILYRGEYDNPGEQVERATPGALPPMAPDLSRDRLGFAKWLVNPDHPLVARVAVNRFWQQLFGVGLVKTSEDLGSQGEWPSHPELLDFLAQRFIDSGWDVKALMRIMVTSDTYKQRVDLGAAAYAADPENRRLARGPRFRMDAEMLRDQALFVSGQLVETMYGPSVKPPQPPGLWKSVSLPGVSRPDRFVADSGDKTLRRSVYTYWKRAYPPPAMTIFNAPNREVCIARRERTNTPLQALVLMNEAQFFAAAKDFGSLASASGDTDESRLRWAYERLTCQQPSPKELRLLHQSLDDFRDHFSDESKAWTMLANALMNLDIVKTKQ